MPVDRFDLIASLIGLVNLLVLLFLIMGEISLKTYGWFWIAQTSIAIYVVLIKYFKEKE